MTDGTEPRTHEPDKRMQIGILAVAALLMLGSFYYRWHELHKPIPSLESRIRQAGQVLRVEIKGAVEKPGVYELPAGSRVSDLLRAAGSAQVDQIPQDWRDVPLTEGTQLEIWPGEGGQPHLAINRMKGDTLGLLFIRFNVNEASVEDLQSLPGIGEKTARAIVAYREAHGPFKTIEDLKAVDGIGDSTVESLRFRVAVGRPEPTPGAGTGGGVTPPASSATARPAGSQELTGR